MKISKIVNKIDEINFLIEQLNNNDIKPIDMINCLKIITILGEYKKVLLDTNIKTMVYERNYE